MGRSPSIPAEKKTRIVLSVLAGEMRIVEAARREKISEQSIGRWKADFLEAGKTALVAGRSGPSTREEQLEGRTSRSFPWSSWIRRSRFWARCWLLAWWSSRQGRSCWASGRWGLRCGRWSTSAPWHEPWRQAT